MVNKYSAISQKVTLLLLIGISFFWAHSLALYLGRDYPIKPQEFRYVLKAQKLQGISANVKTALADIFYIQGVMGVSDDFYSKSARVQWVQDNMATAILFDNQLIEAYFFAGAIIAKSRETLLKGNDFMMRWEYLVPGDWHIPYWIGFNFYELGMYRQAIYFFQKASRLPNAPQFLQSNQSMLYYKGAMTRMGVAYFQDLLEREKDPQKIIWIAAKLKWLKTIVFLEDATREFKRRYGGYPNELPQLVSSGIISAIPEDTFGLGFFWDNKEERVKSKFRK